jgi:hypothetical protein
MKNKINFILFSILLIGGCARKGPPTSPDRTPPKLSSVEALDRYHIEIKMSEAVKNAEAEKIKNFTAYSSIETLNIKASVHNVDKIWLTTDLMDSSQYKLIIRNMVDYSGNIMKEASKFFRGNPNPDTTPPLIISSPKRLLEGVSSDTSFVLRFSEVVDSSLFLLLPPSRFTINWNDIKTETKLEFQSLDVNTVYTLYGVFMDKSHNGRGIQLNAPTFSFTTKKRFPLLSIKGKTNKSSILILTKDTTPIRTCMADTMGLFIFEKLEGGLYNIYAKSDSLYGERDSISLEIPIEDMVIKTDKKSVDNTIIHSYFNTIEKTYFIK